MGIQESYFRVFICLILLQLVCAIKAIRSEKPIGKYVAMINGAIILPIVGNMIIIKARTQGVSYLGYYLSYIGMNTIMVTVINFTNLYCKGVDEEKKHSKPYPIYALAAINMVQLCLGPVFHHVISLESITFKDRVFYRDVPKIGLTFHRITDYFLFLCILLIYIVAVVKTTRLYRGKYYVILITLVASGIFQFISIKTREPIDRSILIHGIFGIVIFYLSIIYRPVGLLDTLLSNVISDMNDAVYVFDNTDRIVWTNERALELLGLKEYKSNEVRKTLFEKFENITGRGENWKENRVVGKNYYILEKKSVKTDTDKLNGSFLVIKDDTERHNAIEKEVYDSRHDSLTGIYNMQYLYTRINELINSSDREYILIYFNVKNFKLINDNFGKEFGDVVLIDLAKWLRANVKNGLFGRLVADTFGVCIPRDEFDERYYLAQFKNFVVIYKNLEQRINIHMGIYVIKNKSFDVSIMFDRAHLAITDIEENYKTVIRYYDEKIKQGLLEEQKLAGDFNDALMNNQIVPYLQPIADRKGKIVGAEALARWIHPEMGFLPPYKFIPLFEKNGVITDLDTHIWESVCKILVEWKKTNPDKFISINISPKDFYFTDVFAVIVNLVRKYDIEPEKVRIEITETAMMNDSEERNNILSKLRAIGFIVEMDDFGSGYSSLNMLKDMPVDLLKLDMKFLSSDNNDKSGIIIKNIINLANELDIITLTEGVETKEQFEFLASQGCELFQGYYFAKPMPVEEFNEYLLKQDA